jgi:hypothetical protein
MGKCVQIKWNRAQMGFQTYVLMKKFSAGLAVIASFSNFPGFMA